MELTERKKRVDGLGIESLDPQVRQELESLWAAAQEQFVEDPAGAATTASDLVVRAAKGRGYPTDNREQLYADLSVHHARRLHNYRRAEETAATLGSAPAPTEELRQALLSYRAMFQELTESPRPARSTEPKGVGAHVAATKRGLPSRTSKLQQALPPAQREGANQA